MKSIQNFNLFDNNSDFQANKQKSIDELMNDHHIVNILNEFHLTRQDIEDNWIEFLDYQEDINQCTGCKGIAQCPKVSVGMRRVFNMKDNQIFLSLTPCQYGSEILENQKILSHILLKNVSDQLLLTNVNQIREVARESDVLKEIAAYIEQPTNKGYYIYGNAGCGKSTLGGFIIKALAKKGYQCGFIHFPTFLMDLKNSFGEDGNDNSMELMKNLDYLFIDDVGGESVTNWSRDEVLSAIIAYRLQNNKVTFFTSIYPIDKLRGIYMLKQGDKQRVDRLIDRMKAVSVPLHLNGRDLR